MGNLAVEVAWTLRDHPRRAFTLGEIRRLAARWEGCRALASGASDDEVRAVLDRLSHPKRRSTWWLVRDGERWAFDDVRQPRVQSAR